MKEEALRLADDMENTGKLNVVGADMIRKLVKELDRYKMAWNMAEDDIEFLKQQLDCANDYIKQYQAEKAMWFSPDGKLSSNQISVTVYGSDKPKPVAWMYEVNDTFILFSANKPPEDAYDEGSLVPLYTAPRELSDEEIREIARMKGFMSLCEDNYHYFHEAKWKLEKQIAFAKAILKKASEK